jgi:hypothetical protein
MNGQTLLLQQTSLLVGAELDPDHFRQVGSKPGRRRSQEIVPEVQRIYSDSSLHRGQKLRRRSARSPWEFDRPQSVDPPVRHRCLTRFTGMVVQPTCLAIDATVSPASDIKMIKQFRKTSAELVENRRWSN